MLRDKTRVILNIRKGQSSGIHHPPLLQRGESLAALGVRQFIAALEYFGVRHVPVPL